MGALPERESSDVNFNPSVFISRTGLRLPQRISFDKWMGIGRHLSGVYSSSAWCLGDWLVYGEFAFGGRYREAIDQTSLDYQTLRNYAWVARKFPMSRRRDKLSFAHHAEVTALSEAEQDFWLRKAEELAWAVKRLRVEVRTSLQERSASEGSGLGNGFDHRTVTLKVAIPMDHLEACRVAASRQGLDLDEWAGQVLTQVALRDSATVHSA
jgi:hypothetical protein